MKPSSLLRWDKAPNCWNSIRFPRLGFRIKHRLSTEIFGIKYSLLWSLAVGGVGFLRLCIGIDEKTGETVLALSDTSTSPITVLE